MSNQPVFRRLYTTPSQILKKNYPLMYGPNWVIPNFSDFYVLNCLIYGFLKFWGYSRLFATSTDYWVMALHTACGGAIQIYRVAYVARAKNAPNWVLILKNSRDGFDFIREWDWNIWEWKFMRRVRVEWILRVSGVVTYLIYSLKIEIEVDRWIPLHFEKTNLHVE